MRIVHTADWHIYDKHKYSLYDSRIKELEKVLKSIVAWSINNDVDYFIVAGDIFHNHNPSENLLKIFAGIIKKAVDGGLKVRVLTGNHDTDGIVTSLDSISDFISIAPKVESGFGSLAILKQQAIFPERISASINLVYIPWASNLRELVKIAKDEDREAKRNLLFTHASVAGAISDSGIVLAGEKVKNTDLKPIDLTGWDYVGLGDYHRPQQIGNNTFKKKNNIFYCGSPIKFTWGERDHTKVFKVIDINGDDLNIHNVKLPDIDFIQMDIDENEFPEIKNVKDSFIKLFVTTKDKRHIADSVYNYRNKLIESGAKDVFITFKGKIKSDGGDSEDGEIVLDLISACKKQLHIDGIKDEEFLKYVKNLENEAS